MSLYPKGFREVNRVKKFLLTFLLQIVYLDVGWRMMIKYPTCINGTRIVVKEGRFNKLPLNS
jgi:hypothetical protein